MDAGVLTALTSATVAIVAAAASYWFTKRREHENAWRELKLRQYQEFIVALSGVVGSRAVRQARTRYADAANSLALVAPHRVLKALYDFQDEISLRGQARDPARHDARLTALRSAMRVDAQSGVVSDDDELRFRLFASSDQAGTVDSPQIEDCR